MAEKSVAIDWRFILRESFDYDLFANRLWLPVVQSSGLAPETKIFKHILAASRIWVIRLGGVSPAAMPDVPLIEPSLLETHHAWIEAIDRLDYLYELNYTNTHGENYTRTLGDIARHVVNHGTYHRGQLREMFGARGLEFPETDFIGFTFERDGVP